MSMMDCLVTEDDFKLAIQDVNESAGDRDWEPSDDEEETQVEENNDSHDTDIAKRSEQ